MHETIPTNKELSNQKISIAKVEKPCTRIITFTENQWYIIFKEMEIFAELRNPMFSHMGGEGVVELEEANICQLWYMCNYWRKSNVSK